MTLKELCALYIESSDDPVACCNHRGNFLMSIKGKHRFESLEKSDLEGLRPFLLCDMLAMYEYLAIEAEHDVEDWFKDYAGVSCPYDDNDDFTVILDFIDREEMVSLYEKSLSRGIEPFKSRGIATDCFDYTV